MNLLDPQASLILRKPGGQMTHGGGRRFKIGSLPYSILRGWLEEGTRSDIGQAPRLKRIEVIPNDATVPQPGLAQQLAVRAHFADGAVTGQAIYELTNDGVVEVDAKGLVTTQAEGEGAVLVRFLGKMALSRLLVIRHKRDFAWDNPPANNFIDKHVFAKLKAIQVNPSELSSDAHFLRRVCLDTIGLPPTVAEVRAFLADSRSDKRTRKIDELLDRPEFADGWALYWMDLLRANESGSVMGRKGVWMLRRWLRQAFDRNMPYDQFVRAFLTAQGSQFQNPPVAFYRVARKPQLKAEGVAQLFLGVRIECAQCHDHPFDRWTQQDYNSMVNFFVQLDKKDGPDYYDEFQLFLRPERHITVSLRLLDGSAVGMPGHRDRREVLLDWMLGPQRRWLARALVNRVWCKLLGRGIVEPVDDLRFSNPPVNQTLWNALADDFIAHKYDFKHLLRTILNSRTYQLSFKPNATNSADRMNFSHARLRRLSAEQLLDSLSQVTGVEELFHGLPPGMRAVEIATVGAGSHFLKLFGRPKRTTTCTCERASEPSLPQILHLLNGSGVKNRLSAKGGAVRKLLAADSSDSKLVEGLYLAVLSRFPSQRERQRATRYLRKSKDHAAGVEDLMWALINSHEFLFNH